MSSVALFLVAGFALSPPVGATDIDAVAQAADPASAAPPSMAVQYNYYGSAGQGTYGVADLVRIIQNQPNGEHYLWSQGWSGWVPWQQVPGVAQAVAKANTPPPPPVLAMPPAPPALSVPTPPAQPPVPPVVASPPAAPILPVVPMPQPVPRPAPVVAALPAPAAPTTIPVPPTPPMPAVPVVEGPVPAGGQCQPPACGQHRMPVGGEIWTGLFVSGMETGIEGPAEAGVGFQVVRGRLHAGLPLGSRMQSYLNVDLSQDGATTTVQSTRADGTPGDSITLANAPNGWAVSLQDAWVSWDIDALDQQIKVGLQAPVFGATDEFSEFGAYFLGGISGYQALAWRAGRTSERDLGVSWHIAPVSTLGIDVQAVNGDGGLALNEGKGLDMIARATFVPVDMLEIQLSGQAGDHGSPEGKVMQLDASVELKLDGPRAIAEILLGNYGETTADVKDYRGVSLAGAWDLEIQKGALGQASVVARYMFFDPFLDSQVYDMWAAFNGAVWLDWTTRPERALRTGLVWEAWIPENALEPVTHTGGAQVACTF